MSPCLENVTGWPTLTLYLFRSPLHFSPPPSLFLSPCLPPSSLSPSPPSLTHSLTHSLSKAILASVAEWLRAYFAA